MSYFHYQASKKISEGDPPFYALIMAAMRKADTRNTALLRAAWPKVWDDLQARHWAPGGVLDSDPRSLHEKVLEASA
jgi:hypothetical protein